jgi:hypothetical protein
VLITERTRNLNSNRYFVIYCAALGSTGLMLVNPPLAGILLLALTTYTVMIAKAQEDRDMDEIITPFVERAQDAERKAASLLQRVNSLVNENSKQDVRLVCAQQERDEYDALLWAASEALEGDGNPANDAYSTIPKRILNLKADAILGRQIRDAIRKAGIDPAQL